MRKEINILIIGYIQKNLIVTRRKRIIYKMLNISTSYYNVLQNLFNYDNIINIYYIKK